MTYTCSYHSSLGTIFLACDDDKLIGLRFDQPYDIPTGEGLPIFQQTKQWLGFYFDGQSPNLMPPCRFDGLTDFQRNVLEIVKSIPYGQTMTYGEIAQQIARQRHITKMSAQAVGRAVGANPICLIVPCHRVMGANNQLTGYGGGIQRKVQLLKLEGHTII